MSLEEVYDAAMALEPHARLELARRLVCDISPASCGTPEHSDWSDHWAAEAMRRAASAEAGAGGTMAYDDLLARIDKKLEAVGG